VAQADPNDPRQITRRTVITTTTFVPLAALIATAQPPETALAPAQLKILEAFIDRLVPKDDLGPGAVECGAATYIDRALGGALAAEKPTFLDGLAGVETLANSAHKAPFADLSPEIRDELLTSMESGTAAGFPNARAFFNRVRRLTLEGMFSDPYYGGNRNFAGWDLIRYPGPRLAVAPEDQRMSAPPKPYRKSAYGSGEHDAH
jgi:gluconate 2-dehydrogenase gamma chain